MTKLLAAGAVLLLALGLYAAAPLHAAWTLKEAIRTGDVATLERKVVWPEVRASLRRSLLAEAAPPVSDIIGAGATPARPTLWQRVKATFAPGLVDGFLDRYVTPSGLPMLFSARASYNVNMRGLPDERIEPWHTRVASLWSRIRRIEIVGPTALVVEVADKTSPERRFVSRMEVREMEWKLVALEVIGTTTTPATGAPRATR